MRRLAVFVEGHTEILFVEKLIYVIAGENQVRIDQREIRGGSTTRRTMRLIKASNTQSDQKYYVLLFDCGGDELVKERIREEHAYLTSINYEKIIGIRDVRPQYTHAEIAKLEAWLPKYIKTALIPVEFVLSIMEIEAWFLAEHTHFPRVDPAVTVPAIQAALGFNPEHQDMSQRSTPTDDMQACYQLGGKHYEKGKADSTIAALDFPFVYLELTNKIPYLKKLTDSIDLFLS